MLRWISVCGRAVVITPAGSVSLVAAPGQARLIPVTDGGLPHPISGSAPALNFSRIAQRSLALRPARSLDRLAAHVSRRLRRLCCLHRRFDSYRLERPSCRAGISPAEDPRLGTAHNWVRSARFSRAVRAPDCRIAKERTPPFHKVSAAALGISCLAKKPARAITNARIIPLWGGQSPGRHPSQTPGDQSNFPLGVSPRRLPNREWLDQRARASGLYWWTHGPNTSPKRKRVRSPVDNDKSSDTTANKTPPETIARRGNSTHYVLWRSDGIGLADQPAWRVFHKMSRDDAIIQHVCALKLAIFLQSQDGWLTSKRGRGRLGKPTRCANFPTLFVRIVGE